MQSASADVTIRDQMSDDRQATDQKPRRRGLDGRVLGGRYEVVRTVAAGANTLIADAVDRDLERTVTVKLVRPELSESESFRRAFRKQMDEMTAISHPNLAAVYDWGEEQIGKRGTVYVVVEYLSGGSLRDLFDRGRNLTPSQALMVGLEACRGLDFAHREGLVHTELTPSKLVFGDDRRLRIVDFGLARLLGEQEWRDPSQVAHHVARYASPEQAQGEPLDGKTDVYSLALILVEAVTDSVPFVGDSTVSTLSARVGKLMPVSADLGPLAAVLERAGRPEPGERFSASQFGRALVRAAEKLPRPAPIPILSTTRFDAPAAMRRPDDPTGGVARPPAEPEPALVTPSPTPVSPTDTTAEIGAGGGDRPSAPDAARADEPQGDADADTSADGSATTIDATDEPPGARSAATNGDVAAAADAPAPQQDATPGALARRGAKADPAPIAARPEPGGARPELAGAMTTKKTGRDARRARRRRKAEAKQRQRAEAKNRKAAAKAEKAEAKARERGGEPPKPASAVPEAVVTAPRRAAGAEPPRQRWLPWFVGIFLLAILAGLAFVAWMLFRTPEHEIPAVVGLDQEIALDMVDDFKWEIGLESGRSDEHRTPGVVIRTSPPVGEMLAEGSPLLLVISEGPEFRQVPDLSGVPLADALDEIEALELTALPPEEEFHEEVDEGLVISASVDNVPLGGDVLPGAEVHITVSNGPQPRRVPQMQGLTVEQATTLVTDLGLSLNVEDEEVFHDEVPAGQIAVQQPAVDSAVDRGASITVSVSKGPDLVTMPDLSGMTVPQLDQALLDAGLRRGTLLGARGGTFFNAQVDGEEVGAGDQIKRGTEVDIIALVQ